MPSPTIKECGCFYPTDPTPAHTMLGAVDYCNYYEGWNFNSGNYLFTTDTK